MPRRELKPLARIEGLGRVALEMEDGRVKDARVELLEDNRLFEQLVIGRSFTEVPALVCRICSICTAVHRVAAAMAIEAALDIGVPPMAQLLRELLLLGGQLESHALHLGALIYPDLRGTESLLELLRANDGRARDLLAFKAVANRIQELAGGRKIHPISIEVGGVLSRPPDTALKELAGEMAGLQKSVPELLAEFSDPAAYPPAVPVIARRLRVVAGPNRFWGTALQAEGAAPVAAREYASLLHEQEVHWSHARQSSGPGSPYLTGALARHTVAEAQEGWPNGIHANNAAQAREIVEALSRALELIEELLRMPTDAPLQCPVLPRAGSGVALLEAPRGVLVHRYLLDEGGRVRSADIITPTAINQLAMEAQLQADLQLLPRGSNPELAAARIIRGFDPCVSCAVHVLEKSH